MAVSRKQEAWSAMSDGPLNKVHEKWENHGKTWTEKDRFEAEVARSVKSQMTYQRGELLGTGGWSKVYKVRRVRDGEIFAGKLCRTLRMMRTEAHILKMMNHDHILKYVDWDENLALPDETLMITELCVGGTLQQRIDDSSNGLPGLEALDLLVQISSALAYLHSSGHFHSDVKPRNIMIRSLKPIHVVLGDCADIKNIGEIPNSRPRGTPAYFSPEILLFNRCSGTGDDMWALGITMLGMIGQWPQMDVTKDGVRRYPQKCNAHVLLLRTLNKGDEMVENLLMKLLAWDVKERMTASECMEKAREAQNSGRWDHGKVKLRIPEDFKPVSFW